MKAFDYRRPLETANRMIARYGAAAQLLRDVPGSGPQYDPGPSTPESKDVQAVQIEWEDGQVDGTRILATDKRFLIAVGNGSAVPTTEHRLQWAGVAHSIIAVKPLAPGALTVLYDAQCRTA